MVSFLHEQGIHSFTTMTHKEQGTVEDVTISAGGSSCAAGGTLAAKGGGGSGFAATFTVSGGAINAITITSKGEGYKYAPILWIDSGGTGCSNYDLAPVMAPAGDYNGAAITTVSGRYQVSPLLIEGRGLRASYFNNVWLHGDPAIERVDSAIDFDWGNGPVTPFAADRASARWEGVIQIEPSAHQPVSGLRGGVRAVEVVSPGSGCSSDGTLTASGGGGAGFEASFTVAGYVDANGRYGVGIDKVTIINPGSQYTSIPGLSIASGGTGCQNFRLNALLSSTLGMATDFYVETDGYLFWQNPIPCASSARLDFIFYFSSLFDICWVF